VLDGSKALARAVKDVFDKPVIHRCQQHKIRNVIDKLPDKLRSVTEKRMRQAYHAESALKAEAELQALARELDKTHPGAAASLREGMAETLTVLRLGVPPTLARTLRSTNSIVISSPDSGVLAVAAAGVLYGFCHVADALSAQCRRRGPVQIPLSLRFLELSGYYVNAVRLHVYAADVLVRHGVDRDGLR
jgi:hypothetical protein